MLALCAAQGLCDAEVVAIDGAKMAADASLQANRTAKPIAEEAAGLAAQIEAMLAAQAAQTSQDSLPGPRPGPAPAPALALAAGRDAAWLPRADVWTGLTRRPASWRPRPPR